MATASLGQFAPFGKGERVRTTGQIAEVFDGRIRVLACRCAGHQFLDTHLEIGVGKALRQFVEDERGVLPIVVEVVELQVEHGAMIRAVDRGDDGCVLRRLIDCQHSIG